MLRITLHIASRRPHRCCCTASRRLSSTLILLLVAAVVVVAAAATTADHSHRTLIHDSRHHQQHDGNDRDHDDSDEEGVPSAFGRTEDNDDNDSATSMAAHRDQVDVGKLQATIMAGLGLSRIPDMSRSNVSHHEYRSKMAEYLQLRNRRELREALALNATQPPVMAESRLMTFRHRHVHPRDIHHRLRRSVPDDPTPDRFSADLVYIRFTLPIDDLPADIDDARLRLMIRRHPASPSLYRTSAHHQNHHHPRHLGNKHHHADNAPARPTVSVHQILERPIDEDDDDSRLLLLSERTIFLGHEDATHADHQYLDLDVTDAVNTWLQDPHTNLGLQLHCVGCVDHLMHIVHIDSQFERTPLTASSSGDEDDANATGPELYVVGRHLPSDAAADSLAGAPYRRPKRSRQHRHFQAGVPTKSGAAGANGHRAGRVVRRTECANGNKRCCRHRLDIVFKEVQGFEFIMQPLHFDAGYCHGRCPPRYNPAHHHALLQSMIWLQSPERVGRPCCAPSKLEALEVLHADEMDASKMKVSTWLDMRVLECACS